MIYEKLGLTEDVIAILAQQQAEAVERAVLRERCAQLERRLQEAHSYREHQAGSVFEALRYAGKLTGADEDRVLPVAQVLQAVVELWGKVTGKEEAPAETSGFRVSVSEIALFYAKAQGYPFLAGALEAELGKMLVTFTRATDVVSACEDIWDDLLDEYEKEPATDFDLEAFAAKYATEQGRDDLSGMFANYLIGAAAVANQSSSDFCQHADLVSQEWARVLHASREPEEGEE